MTTPVAPRTRDPLGVRRRGLDALLAESASRIALLAVSKDRNAKVTLMVFGSGSTVPDLAVKMPTTDAAARVIEQEARILVELRRLRLPILDRTVPRFVQTVEQRGRTASAVTALPGVPMSTRYHDWHHTARESLVRRDFALAAGWLQEVQFATAGPAGPVELAERWSEPIQERWADEPDIEWLTDRLAALHEVLLCLSTPSTVVHGDFWCGNILIDGDRVTGVVDWESGQVEDEPLRDLARFPLAYALYLDRHTATGRRVAGHPGMRAGPPGRGVLRAFDSTTWFGALVRDFVSAGLERLGAPPGMWRHVLMAGIAEIAATADHPVFARLHLDLLRSLLEEVPLPLMALSPEPDE